ncbi:hypothetical protein C8Q74DRAFT_216979 [Fomes fomentarius]|nr:hypothetical protein C8Q74DRAFT_216979 [Fomes fomentarius]
MRYSALSMHYIQDSRDDHYVLDTDLRDLNPYMRGAHDALHHALPAFGLPPESRASMGRPPHVHYYPAYSSSDVGWEATHSVPASCAASAQSVRAWEAAWSPDAHTLLSQLYGPDLGCDAEMQLPLSASSITSPPALSPTRSISSWMGPPSCVSPADTLLSPTPSLDSSECSRSPGSSGSASPLTPSTWLPSPVLPFSSTHVADRDKPPPSPKKRRAVKSDQAWMCNLCGATGNYKRNFTTHRKEAHDPTFVRKQCEFCECSYQRAGCLARHKAKEHPTQQTIRQLP